MHSQQIAAIDAWIAMQAGEISRPEAIRRLVELGLRDEIREGHIQAFAEHRADAAKAETAKRRDTGLKAKGK